MWRNQYLKYLSVFKIGLGKKDPTTLVWGDGSNNYNNGRLPEGVPEEEIHQ